MNPFRHVFVLAAASVVFVPVRPAVAASEDRAEFRLSFRVTDDAGRSVPGATVTFSWGGLPPNGGRERATTDAWGVVSFTGRTSVEKYAFSIRREGHYSYEGIHGRFREIEAGRWLPWGERKEILLKPVKNPVPIFTRTIAGHIPAKDRWIGYDLARGDWLPPHGAGERADIEMFAQGKVTHYARNYDGTLQVRFPESGAGILAFGMTSPEATKLFYEAPGVGYASEWTWRTACHTKDEPHAVSAFIDESDPWRGFVFRIRPQRDDRGAIVRAWHGKILGGVYFDPRGAEPRGTTGLCHVKFTYYLNRDGTTNVEFDPGKF